MSRISQYLTMWTKITAFKSNWALPTRHDASNHNNKTLSKWLLKDPKIHWRIDNFRYQDREIGFNDLLELAK